MHRTIAAIITPIALLILSIAVMMPMSASAQSPIDFADNDGILGDPPTTMTFFFMPLVQATVDSAQECPIQSGEGYLCSAPETLDVPQAGQNLADAAVDASEE